MKGKNPGFLQDVMNKHSECYINQIVFSEFVYHYIGITTGKSPLLIKGKKQIGQVLKKYNVMQFYLPSYFWNQTTLTTI